MVDGMKTQTVSTQILNDPVFRPLPLGKVRPDGWLKRQLRIQADGLSGHIDEFWPDIAESKWFGGKAEGWERAPYWLDGFIPLAYLLDDAALIERANSRMDYIIDHQREDGWLGPDDVERDVWPLFLIVKSLLQYAEASGSDRPIQAADRLLRRIDRWIGTHGLCAWAQMRWPELALVAQAMCDRTGDRWFAELSARAARFGYDWVTHFIEFPFREKSTRWDMDTHVVNHAMALKLAAILYRLSGAEDDRDLARVAFEQLDCWHGQANGMFTGDEALAGLMPSQGTELCAVVEAMYSLEILVGTLGEAWLGDRLEKIAFNALPATFSPDMWAHQYDQQANQIRCAVIEDCVYTTNGSDSNIFGLEPNYGCCTANMHQGWPKFAAHLWMSTRDADGTEGLAAIAYAPCTVHTTVNDTDVTLSVATRYPFEDSVIITVHTETPVRLPLLLRIPTWCESASVIYGTTKETPDAGTFHRIDRMWEDGATISMHLPMTPRVIDRPYGVSVERGPLVYSLFIGEEWRRIHEEATGRELPHGDWEVHPTSAWNFALIIDRKAPEKSFTFEERHVGATPFSPSGTPVICHARGQRVPEWGVARDAADAPPRPPFRVEPEMVELSLIPYGCTNLRITEFPVAP